MLPWRKVSRQTRGPVSTARQAANMNDFSARSICCQQNTYKKCDCHAFREISVLLSGLIQLTSWFCWMRVPPLGQAVYLTFNLEQHGGVMYQPPLIRQLLLQPSVLQGKRNFSAPAHLLA
jgi:hypothetical protein